MASRYLKILSEQERPVWFLASRLMMRSGLSRWFKIRQEGFVLGFFPTSLSASLWIAPDQRHLDSAFFHSYLKPGDQFVDVGANIGSTALAAWVSVGASGSVQAIEPNPRIYGYLLKNIELNKAKNVQTFNMAVGVEPSQIMFSDTGSDDQNHILEQGKGISVKLDTLDNILKPDGNIDLLKIDVEGYEIFALRGAQKTLERTSCVYIESYEMNFQRYGYGTGAMLECLWDRGFSVFRQPNEGRLTPVGRDHISRVCENLIAVKSVDELVRRTGCTVAASPLSD
ncbi:FkbM family methyltransferase [Singulisphaera acidiphila]|uniref:Methyltransferase, FkbM family n=1 Tax=Singulisphaera acidiphila (strain ATCC BAA-1392 / DSM 18658 / VKM B-2454 / MOB10) TaxID=886293 RepID=L0DFU6_SINAD|nr:FkbM family methyltransferase [Singulisphaera acidiphila]AGA28132.1 methyltransferase, FkbM family [Singulisphaera acidiphila DSM 18658]